MKLSEQTQRTIKRHLYHFFSSNAVENDAKELWSTIEDGVYVLHALRDDKHYSVGLKFSEKNNGKRYLDVTVPLVPNKTIEFNGVTYALTLKKLVKLIGYKETYLFLNQIGHSEVINDYSCNLAEAKRIVGYEHLVLMKNDLFINKLKYSGSYRTKLTQLLDLYTMLKTGLFYYDIIYDAWVSVCVARYVHGHLSIAFKHFDNNHLNVEEAQPNYLRLFLRSLNGTNTFFIKLNDLDKEYMYCLIPLLKKLVDNTIEAYHETGVNVAEIKTYLNLVDLNNQLESILEKRNEQAVTE